MDESFIIRWGPGTFSGAGGTEFLFWPSTGVGGQKESLE